MAAWLPAHRRGGRVVADCEDGSSSAASTRDRERRRPPGRARASHAACIACTLLALISWPLWSPRAWALVQLRSGLFGRVLTDASPRQLLIVGTQSSGTSAISLNLTEALGLEIAHESSDASQSPCRDGTVSWVHGLRFVRAHADAEAVRALCAAQLPRLGLLRNAFRAPRECGLLESLQAWPPCQQRACSAMQAEQRGCGLRARPSCAPPFARTLLQVRHPLHVIASLAAKFCPSGPDGPLDPAFATALRALWPHHPWAASSCVGSAGWYVALYNEDALAAVEDGRIHAWYAVERSGVCDVARLGGFTDQPPPAGACVHAPSCERVRRACEGGASAPREPGTLALLLAGFSRALPFALPGAPRRGRNRQNRRAGGVDLQQIRAVDGGELARRVLQLCGRLGYACAPERAGARALPRPGRRARARPGEAAATTAPGRSD